MQPSDTTESFPEGPLVGDVAERDALFVAYLEGDLEGERRAKLERELESDDELREEFELFSHVTSAAQSIPIEFAPDDFVDRVERRIRTRSRNRFFSDNFLYSRRMPYEAIAVVMIAVMAAAWLLMGTPKDDKLEDVYVEIPPELQSKTLE
ncbi:MAG: anti-sigma factor family protein [Persicimonas sp.]